MPEDLEDEARHATELLSGKTVRSILRHRPNEVLIEFTDGARLFVDTPSEALELSITPPALRGD